MIKVSDLTYRYPNAKENVIENLSFHIPKGEIVGFLGPSGSGKSTTQKLLIKLLDGYEGSIEIMGKPLESFRNDYYERIGVSFELPNHYSKLTAMENLRYFQAFYQNQTRSIEELLAIVGLLEDKDKRVEEFSKGMKMRLNFVRALLNDGDILFFDEPTTGLDPVNAMNIKNLILEEKKKGKTIFVTTHDMLVADYVCDKVCIISSGKILEMDSPDALKHKYGSQTLELAYEFEGEIKTESFSLVTYGSDPTFLNIIQQYKTKSIHSKETTLEDVFIKVAGRGLTV